MASRGFERSARRWLRAYPAWWRSRRGEEVVGLLEELADDGARHVDLRTGLGLVRGGWATRWRARPPWHSYLLYRLGFGRLPAEHRWWAAHDIAGRFFPLRDMAFLLVVLTAISVLPLLWAPGHGSVDWRSFTGVVVLAAGSFLPVWARRIRRLAWERVFAPRGEHDPVLDRYGEPAVTHRLRPRVRVAASPGLRRAAVVLALGAVMLPAAAALAAKRLGAVACEIEGLGYCWESIVVPRSPGLGAPLVGALVVSAVVAAVLAVRAARRVRRTSLPAQPHRELADPGEPRGSVLAVVAITTVAVAEISGAIVQLFAAPLAVGCVAGLGLVVGQLAGLRGREDADEWAAVDAWRASMSRSGQVPAEPPAHEFVLPDALPEPPSAAARPLPG